MNTIFLQGDMTCAVSKAKAAPIDNFNSPQAAYSHPFMEAHKQAREADVWAPSNVAHAPNKKVIQFVICLDVIYLRLTPNVEKVTARLMQLVMTIFIKSKWL